MTYVSKKSLLREEKAINEIKGHALLIKAYNFYHKNKDEETCKYLMKMIVKKENLISSIVSLIPNLENFKLKA
jgi:hypothetical protein